MIPRSGATVPQGGPGHVPQVGGQTVGEVQQEPETHAHVGASLSAGQALLDRELDGVAVVRNAGGELRVACQAGQEPDAGIAERDLEAPLAALRPGRQGAETGLWPFRMLDDVGTELLADEARRLSCAPVRMPDSS